MAIRNKILIGILIIMFLIAVFYPILAPYDENDFCFSPVLSPSKTHWLGTDEMGRDIYSMVLSGFRITIFIAVISAVLSTILGTVLGVIAAYCKGWVDELVLTFTEFFIIIPEIVIILFFAVFSKPKAVNTIIAITFFSWSKVCRIVRSKAMVAMEREKVQYTILLKGSMADIIKKIWPEIRPVVTVMFILQTGKAAVYESTLSFLGVGNPVLKSWGRTIKSALSYEGIFIDGVYKWYLLPPIICLCVFVMTISLLTYERD
ncbi:MAG: ABC transporter permease [Natronincolaceae bacterium]|jgi:peptide/nickel transport system permease protein